MMKTHSGVDFPLIGKFINKKNDPATASADVAKGIVFIPNPEFVEHGNFNVAKNSHTVALKSFANMNALTGVEGCAKLTLNILADKCNLSKQ